MLPHVFYCFSGVFMSSSTTPFGATSFTDSFGVPTNFINSLANIVDIDANSNFPGFYNSLLNAIPSQLTYQGEVTTDRDITLLGQLIPKGSVGFFTQPLTIDRPAALQSFLSVYTQYHPFPTDIDTFVAQFKTAAQSYFSGNSPAIIAALNAMYYLPPDSPYLVTSNSLVSSLPGSFTNYSGTDLATALGADYSQKVNIPADFTGLITPSSVSNEAKAWFNNFLKNYSYPNTGTVGTTSFLTNMGTALATTAALHKNSSLTTFSSLANTDTVPIDNAAEILRYEKVFTALFPSGQDINNSNTFQQRVQAFYQDQVAKYGYFDPSQAFAAWVGVLQAEYNAGPPPTPDLTTLAGMHAEKARVLNRIYNVIQGLIVSVQDVAKAQASRLLVLNRWQQAYTDLSSKIPIFTKGNPVPEATLGFTARGDLNSTINAVFRTDVQTNQSSVSTDAKALQANINQSNDAVTQQTNFASSLMQTINSLLTTLFQHRK